MIEITYLPLINAPSSFRRMSLDDAIAEIRTGKYNGKVDACRMEFLENGKSIEYKSLKDNLPSYIFAGTFDKRVANDTLLQASGIFNVDIDGLGYAGAKECIEFLKTVPECIFAFLSPSADGVKAGIKIGIVNSDFEYKQYFNPVQELLGRYKNDSSIKDIRRACYVSTDKDIYYNPNALPLVIELDEPKPKTSVVVAQPQALDDVVVKALDYLSSDDRAQWIDVGMALKNSGYDISVWDNWSKKSNLYNANDIEYRWASFKPSSIQVATIIYRAEQNGFIRSGHEINYDDFPDSEEPQAQLKIYDLTVSAEFYDFISLCVDSIGKESKEIEAIDKISDLIINRSKGFTKSLAEHIAKEFCEQVAAFSKSKVSLKTGIIDRVKQKNRKNQIDDFKKKNVFPLNIPLPPESFPNFTISPEGNFSIKASLPNLKHILKSYGISAVYDEAIKKQELIIPGKESLGHDLHNDAMTQEVISLAGINDIKINIVDMLSAVMTENTINPVKDWILSKEWDGESRLNDFYSTLDVNPENKKLSYKVLRTWLIQCVAALDRAEIGCELNMYAVPKYELILVLQGEQGLNKTEWFSDLLPRIYGGKSFSMRYIKKGSNLNLTNTDSIKQNISCWINELGELDATFKKSDISLIKAFTSNQYDRIRLPWGRAENDFRRSTSFGGSVNDERFLGDETGSRRFGVIAVNSIKKFKGDLQQLWREVWDLYANGEQWWLDKETEKAMQLNNADNHKTTSSLDDRIATRFDWASPESMWTNKLTATGIYAACFENGKPTQKELLQIKPIVVGRFKVKVGASNGTSTYSMPQLNTEYDSVVNNELYDFSDYE